MAIVISIDRGRTEGIDVIRDRLGDSGNIRNNVTPILREASRVGATTARIHAPQGATGKLQNAITNDSISFRVRGDLVDARFGVQPVGSPGRGSRLYPLYVHEGTGLHARIERLIVAKRAKKMVFPAGGKAWPTRFGKTGSVSVTATKGQRAQPYMRFAFEEANAYVDAHLNDLLDRLVD